MTFSTTGLIEKGRNHAKEKVRGAGGGGGGDDITAHTVGGTEGEHTGAAGSWIEKEGGAERKRARDSEHT